MRVIDPSLGTSLQFNKGQHSPKTHKPRTWCVNDLPTQVFVVAMSHKQRFGSERVRLDIDVRACDLVHPTAFANIGESAHQQRPCSRIKGRETGHVLPNLIEVRKRCLLTFEDGAHPSKGSTFQTFAPIRCVSVFDHADHIPGNRFHQRSGRVDLPQGKFVMVAVVQGVAQVGVERVNVVQSRKIGQDLGKTLRDGLLCEFDLANTGKYGEKKEETTTGAQSV